MIFWTCYIKKTWFYRILTLIRNPNDTFFFLWKRWVKFVSQLILKWIGLNYLKEDIITDVQSKKLYRAIDKLLPVISSKNSTPQLLQPFQVCKKSEKLLIESNFNLKKIKNLCSNISFVFWDYLGLTILKKTKSRTMHFYYKRLHRC
jgi:hypothetical protein